MWRKKIFVLALGISVSAAACGDDETATALHPEGPPMIAQVFVQEKVTSGTTVRIRQGLAFGDHPQQESDPNSPNFDDRNVDAAVARGNQQIRIVLDEIIRGNSLEELACNDGSFSRIEVGTDPDDIADCSGVDLTKCAGPNAVCVGPNGPIGILDENEDGAADDFRMIKYGGADLGEEMGGSPSGACTDALDPDGSCKLAVRVECDGRNIPLDQNQSFYNPSGNQQMPAGSGGVLNPNGLGPVIVLVPRAGMRTGARCSLAFEAAVVDKDNNQVCAPEGGDFLGRPCTPGDLDRVAFNVEPMQLLGNDPPDGGTGVPLTVGGQTFANILLQFNAGVDQTAAQAAITVRDNTAGADVPVTVSVSMDDEAIVTARVDGGYNPDSDYTVTVSTGVTDVFGGALPESTVINFSTSAPLPDAAVPDAGIDSGL